MQREDGRSSDGGSGRVAVAAALVLALGTAGCADSTTPADAAVEAGADAGADAGTDAGPACGSGEVAATQCARCGPTDECLERETVCVPECETDADCAGTGIEICDETRGHCLPFLCG